MTQSWMDRIPRASCAWCDSTAYRAHLPHHARRMRRSADWLVAFRCGPATPRCRPRTTSAPNRSSARHPVPWPSATASRWTSHVGLATAAPLCMPACAAARGVPHGIQRACRYCENLESINQQARRRRRSGLDHVGSPAWPRPRRSWSVQRSAVGWLCHAAAYIQCRGVLCVLSRTARGGRARASSFVCGVAPGKSHLRRGCRICAGTGPHLHRDFAASAPGRTGLAVAAAAEDRGAAP
jgi:hypothetical protein